MKRNIFLRILALVVSVAVCLGMVACTTSIKNPSITDEKAKLTGVRIQAENKTWHEADAEDAEKLFKLVKGLGDLPTEPIEIGLSGKYSYEVTYDYSFEISYETGNFFHKKKSCFTYNLGELRVRKNADGTEKTAYFENKLVVRKPLIKYMSNLSDEKCQTIIDICEPINAEVMAAAFDVMASGNFLMTVPKTEADVDTTVVTCTVADGKADIYQNFNGSERVYAQQMPDGTWQIYEWTTDGWGAQDEPVASLFAYCGVETLIGLAAEAELTYDDVLLCYHGTVMMDTAELNVTVYFQGGRVSSIRFASAGGDQAAVLSFVYGGQCVSLPFGG